MGITLAQKRLSTSSMLCSQTAQITLSLAASNDVTANPVDIMLVLDRSGSMNEKTDPQDPAAPTKIEALKEAATMFTQIIANATTGTTPPTESPTIDTSTIGVVSFADQATYDLALNQTVAEIDQAINDLDANGRTNHADAFLKARDGLEAGTNGRKVLILITDGLSTAPQPNPVEQATQQATLTRDAGIIIYGIGLGEDASQANLETWTNDPARVLMAPSTADLQATFEALAANIVNPAPENITVVDTVEDNFEIVGPFIPLTPTGVTPDYELSNNNRTITWKLDSLGLTEPQTASISYGIRYTGNENGTFPVNKTITYNDTTTPDPSKVYFTNYGNTISLICDNIVRPDCDFACKTADVPCCGGVVDVVMQNATTAYDIQCDGTILNIITRFRNICPNRRLAIGVIVCSTVNGKDEAPVYRITTVNTPNSRSQCDCQDFAVPVEILLPPSENACADQRQVRVRVIAHYLANSFSPCRACFIK